MVPKGGLIVPDGLTGLTMTGGAAPIGSPGGLPAAGSLEQQAIPVPQGMPVGGAASTFNIGGAPIAILGGVFSGGMPIGGPVTQIFRGGSAPIPPTLFVATITDSGPIANFLLGTSGAPIGVEAFGGGGLPIAPTQAIVTAIQQLEPRTAAVTAIAVAFGGGTAASPAGPIDGSGFGRVPSTMGV